MKDHHYFFVVVSMNSIFSSDSFLFVILGITLAWAAVEIPHCAISNLPLISSFSFTSETAFTASSRDENSTKQRPLLKLRPSTRMMSIDLKMLFLNYSYKTVPNSWKRVCTSESVASVWRFDTNIVRSSAAYSPD